MDTKIVDLMALEIKGKVRKWKPYMEKYDCQFAAELGVFEGRNFRYMMESNPKVLVAVDSWVEDGNAAHNDSGYAQAKLDSQYNAFLEMVKDKPFVKLVKDYTYNAVKQFPDNYFDLIYIDADHTYEGCLRDMRDWWPKMKSGGAFTGDDYTRSRAKHTGVKFGVVEAVQTFIKETNTEVFELPRHGWAIIKA